MHLLQFRIDIDILLDQQTTCITQWLRWYNNNIILLCVVIRITFMRTSNHANATLKQFRRVSCRLISSWIIDWYLAYTNLGRWGSHDLSDPLKVLPYRRHGFFLTCKYRENFLCADPKNALLRVVQTSLSPLRQHELITL